jgi:hypothetical protein
MRVDNRVNQPPPTRHRYNEATSRSANHGPNRTRAELPAQPNRTRRRTSTGWQQQPRGRPSPCSCRRRRPRP